MFFNALENVASLIGIKILKYVFIVLKWKTSL